MSGLSACVCDNALLALDNTAAVQTSSAAAKPKAHSLAIPHLDRGREAELVQRLKGGEEVAQDTWLAVVEAIDGFEGRSRLSTWIFGIAINKARSRALREGRHLSFSDLARQETDGGAEDGEPFLEDGSWAEPMGAWERIDPERIVAGRQMWAHAWQEIEALPPAQRAVVILRDIEDRDMADIAQLLGIQEAHGRVLLHRARSRLRKDIDRLQKGMPALAA